MAEQSGKRAALENLVIDFTEAFNRDDLDGVMSCRAEGAIYDEFNGKRSVGKPAIREAFVPQFRGDYGKIRFETEDMFVDVETGKALIRWLCVLETEERRSGWRGLDILHFEDGLLTEKLTYAKAKVPLFVEGESK
jgi:ketosteroid isomerase-like protein